MKTYLSIIAFGAAAFASQASAHVVLENAEAQAGNYYKATLMVPHGCDGKPTTGLRVQIPEGVIGVKPKLKDGWDISTQTGDYATPVTFHGTEVKQGVTEIDWQDGKIPDTFFDEFSFQAYLAPALADKEHIDFPAIQICGDNQTRWIDVSGNKDAEHPAPRLYLDK